MNKEQILKEIEKLPEREQNAIAHIMHAKLIANIDRFLEGKTK